MNNKNSTKWNIVRFGDLLESDIKVDIKKGQSYESLPMEMISSSNKFPKSYYVKEFNGSGSRFENGDTVFARITPCLQNGKIAKIKNLKNGVGFGSTEFFVFRAKKNIADPDYVFYAAKTDEIRIPAEKSMFGASGRQRADKSVIENTVINVPNLSTQKQIAEVLSVYDDLIENNNLRIKILEDMAQKTYIEWFVKFRFPGHEKVKIIESKTEFGKIPEEWQIKTIGDMINIPKGKNITKETISLGVVPVVAGGIEPAYYHNVSNSTAPTVTISASGANSGFVNIYYEDIWASDCSYINKTVTDFVFFYYSLLKEKQVEITHLQRGSAQPHVYPKDIMSIKSAFPKNQLIIKNFENSISALYLKISNLKKQIKNLKKSRDLLIPQLVTGKLEIKYE